MIYKKNFSKKSKDLFKNDVDFSETFRHNIWKYAEQKSMTIVDVANKSQIPINTINSFLHHVSNDMKVSNVAKIAKTLDISIDELVGSDTLSEPTKESIQICRNMPENDLYLIRWFIRYLDSLRSKNKKNERYLSVMELECNSNGNLKITTQYQKIDITNIDPEVRGKVFFGITMPCDHYMPLYSPYDILLIANDRKPTFKEHCLIRIDGLIHIAKRINENNTAKYYSIRDGKYRIDEKDIDELIGYVACKITK